MARKQNDREILEEAVGAFKKTTGLDAEPDRDEAFRIVWRGRKWRFGAVIKPWLNAATAGLHNHNYPGKGTPVLVARHIHKAVAEQMRRMHVQYMDTDGNTYIDAGDLFVHVQGQRGAKAEWGGDLGRLFRPAGMKVMFALLCNPGLERNTYREIADVTKTALGTINWTMEALREAGHLLETEGAGRRIVKREMLFDKWVAAYPEQLRPKQLLGRYIAPERNWWRTARLNKVEALWGGETAAALETGYLEPEITTVYVDDNPNELILRNKLKKDPLGPVEVFKKFWHFRPAGEEKQTVPLPLIYADLLATGNDRNVEAAGILREKKLDGYF